MKIAILTQPLHTNYGGILQAYAVQKILKDMGHDVVTLDIQTRREQKIPNLYSQLRIFAATLVLFLVGRNKAKDIVWPYSTRKRNADLIRYSMRPFISQIINLSHTITSECELKEYVKKNKFDAFVVGSDQVWRPKYSPNIGWFLLDFLNPDNPAKRIALSASFGTSEKEFSQDLIDYLKPFAERFDAISVRELSGIKLCQEYWNIKAVQTLDPTMMLTSADYNQIVQFEKNNTYSMEGTIMSYILDDSETSFSVIDTISIELGLSVQSLKADNNKFGPYTNKREIVKYFPKPVSQWLRGFQETEFVITDSFHGTVFSILHHKPFVVLRNNSRGISRLETLLDIFDLKDRIVDSDSQLNRNWLLSGIQWDKVNLILDTNRNTLNHYIINALKL